MAARGKNNHNSRKPLSVTKLVLICVIGLVVGVALIADLQLIPYYSSPAPNPDPNTNTKEVVQGVSSGDKKDGIHVGRLLSKTFADLPGPQLHWDKMADSPVPRLDGAAIQIKDQLFVFAGYGTIDLVHSHVDVYNFTSNTWGDRFDMPKEMAHSHLGMVTDGRYIYIVTGQYGPQCRGPTAHTFVLDTKTKKWQDMPPLPVPRYAPATQLWRGRLHVMGGSKEDRYTVGVDHWSIAVKDGKVLEKEWRTEMPIPRGGPHRACVVVDDRLYMIGGQEGDFMAKPNSPIFKCSRRNEVVYSDVYMLDDEMKWKVLPSMPKPDSHIEFAWAVVNNSIIIAGGTTEKHPETKKMILVGEVFQFQLDTLGFTANYFAQNAMGGRIHKKRCKTGISAQKRLATNIASQLEDKFAKMRLTPSQSVVNDHHTRHEFYKELGIGPQLPRGLYNRVKIVVDCLEQLEKHPDDRTAQGGLAVAEAHIKVLVRYYKEDLPRGWKYDRANALALLV